MLKRDHLMVQDNKGHMFSREFPYGLGKFSVRLHLIQFIIYFNTIFYVKKVSLSTSNAHFCGAVYEFIL